MRLRRWAAALVIPALIVTCTAVILWIQHGWRPTKPSPCEAAAHSAGIAAIARELKARGLFLAGRAPLRGLLLREAAYWVALVAPVAGGPLALLGLPLIFVEPPVGA